MNVFNLSSVPTLESSFINVGAALMLVLSLYRNFAGECPGRHEGRSWFDQWVSVSLAVFSEILGM